MKTPKKEISSALRKKAFAVRTSAGPVESYIDAHGDAPPYTDTHSDGGTYYDHPDTEHNDFHHDEAGMTQNFKGDPTELLIQTVDRLQALVSKFELTYRQRLERVSSETATRLQKIEERIAAIEASVRR